MGSGGSSSTGSGSTGGGYGGTFNNSYSGGNLGGLGTAGVMSGGAGGSGMLGYGGGGVAGVANSGWGGPGGSAGRMPGIIGQGPQFGVAAYQNPSNYTNAGTYKNAYSGGTSPYGQSHTAQVARDVAAGYGVEGAPQAGQPGWGTTMNNAYSGGNLGALGTAGVQSGGAGGSGMLGYGGGGMAGVANSGWGGPGGSAGRAGGGGTGASPSRPSVSAPQRFSTSIPTMTRPLAQMPTFAPTQMRPTVSNTNLYGIPNVPPSRPYGSPGLFGPGTPRDPTGGGIPSFGPNNSPRPGPTNPSGPGTPRGPSRAPRG